MDLCPFCDLGLCVVPEHKWVCLCAVVCWGRAQPTSSFIASMLNLQSLNLGKGRKEERKEGTPLASYGGEGRGGWCRKRPGLALLFPAILDGHRGRRAVSAWLGFPDLRWGFGRERGSIVSQLQPLWDTSCMHRPGAEPSQAGSFHIARNRTDRSGRMLGTSGPLPCSEN